MCIFLRFFVVFFICLCTFFAFFASADRRSRYIRYRDNIGYPRYGESWLSGITNMVKTPATYRLSPIYHFWHFWCDFGNFCVFFAFFCIFWAHFFRNFYVFNIEDFWVHLSSIFCGFSYFFVYIFCIFCFF